MGNLWRIRYLSKEIQKCISPLKNSFKITYLSSSFRDSRGRMVKSPKPLLLTLNEGKRKIKIRIRRATFLVKNILLKNLTT